MKKRPTTILSWLWKLPKKYREAAIKNYKKEPSTNIHGEHNPKTGCMSDALDNGFIWCRTPEGEDFWSEIYSKCLIKERKDEIGIPLDD